MGVGAWLYLCVLVSSWEECDCCLGVRLKLLPWLFVRRGCMFLVFPLSRWVGSSRQLDVAIVEVT